MPIDTPPDVEAFSIAPAPSGEDRAASRRPAQVVMVPPGSNIALGFDAARTLLDRGEQVRLVGHGVICRSAWPEWVAREPGIVLTELGAYITPATLREAHSVCGDFRLWLDDIFGDFAPGIRGNEVYFGAGVYRLIPTQDSFHSTLAAILGLVEAHAGAQFHCVDRRWFLFYLFEKLVEVHGGTIEAAPVPGRVAWGAKLLVLGLGSLCATFAHAARTHFRTIPARRALRRLREEQAGRPAPKLWVGLVADWFRINDHVIQSVAEPALAAGQTLGILLIGNLQSGGRAESDMRVNVGTELWPGLGGLRDALEHCVIDQVAGPETMRGLLAACFRTTLRFARALSRLVVGGPRVGRGSFHLDFSTQPMSLAKFVTIDILRASLAEQATTECLQRRGSLGGAVVAFSGSSMPSEAAADLALQHDGAITINCFHGVANDWCNYLPGPSSSKGVWFEADAEACFVSGADSVASCMPWTGESPRVPARPVRNILILSNYIHRDTCVNGHYPYFWYQEELLRVVEVLRREFPDRFCFRWRPHPADYEPGLMETHGKLESVELSRDRSLDDDLTWADVLISGFSSSIFHALFFDMPIFLHVIPKLRDIPTATCFHPARRFCRVEEIAGPFAECIDRLDRGDPEALAAERETRRVLFGPSGRPPSLHASIEARWLSEAGRDGERIASRAPGWQSVP